ncbi:C40 family peptidase [Yunchengibacter salinarum]|uniref:C40 family peptidase n=1 Tax=Yunchengibacter salinarum TaxID=3133399 RepID=UPI0035B66D6F
MTPDPARQPGINPLTGLPPLHDPLNRLDSDDRLARPIRLDGRVIWGEAPLYRAPDAASPVDTILHYGDAVQIDGRVADDAGGLWLIVVNLADGYAGYLNDRAVAPPTGPVTHQHTALAGHLYARPHHGAPVASALPFGARLSLTGNSQDGFLETAGRQWVFAEAVRPAHHTAPDHVALAEMFLGCPYRLGGRSGAGIDCSGLVQITLAAAGLAVHRDSDLQADSIGQPVDGPPRRGDLAFFPGHVGFMLDDTTMLHATATYMTVRTEPLAHVTARVERDVAQKGLAMPAFSGFRRPFP